MITPGGEKEQAGECGFGINGVVLSADQTRLYAYGWQRPIYLRLSN